MAEQELDQEGKQDGSDNAHLLVYLDQDRPSVLAVLEDECLEVELCKPKCEGDVVGAIEAVPEGTDDEDKQLIVGFVLEVNTLVDALPHPVLHRDVPEIDLLPHVDRRLHDQRVNGVNAFKI